MARQKKPLETLKEKLRIEKLSKTYSNVEALKGVDITFCKGEIHALIGANGAGKSTLVKILNGEIAKTKGEVYINNDSIEFSNPKNARNFGIAKVSQDITLIDSLSVSENIFLGIERIKGFFFLDRIKISKEAEITFAQFNQNINVNQKAENLIASEKQIVAICKALIQDTEILILDEPTSILNTKESEVLFNVLRKLKKKGKLIIYISHRFEDVFAISDKVTVLRDGELIFTKPTKKLSQNMLSKAMLGSEKYLENNEKRSFLFNEKTKIFNITGLSIGKSLNISFSLLKGEVLGIFCREKEISCSHILELIFGIIPNKNKIITIKGKNIQINNPALAIKNGIGFIKEDRKSSGLFENLNLFENLEILLLKKYSRFGFVKSKYLNKKAISSISRFEIICSSLAQPINELSGGNQQKVLLSRWISSGNDILLLSEPTAGVDIKGRKEIYSIIQNAKMTGKSFILSTSDINELIEISDRIIVLNKKSAIEIDINNSSNSEVYEMLA